MALTTLGYLLYGAVALASVGSSTYTSSANRTAAKKATDHQANLNVQALAEAKAVKETSTAQAKESVLSRQRAISRNKTTFTSPLGLNGEANTIKKTLLGE